MCLTIRFCSFSGWVKQNKTFSVPTEIKEVTRIHRNGSGSVVTISYKIKFIDTARFNPSSLSNLVDNFAKGSHKIKFTDCDCFLEYESANENLIKYKCPSRNKDYLNKIDEELKRRFENIYKFSNNGINKLFCCWEKGFYSYEYMDELWMNV